MNTGLLDRLFYKGRAIRLSTEVEGGLATFFTMSYIIFVQPAVLSRLGMDFGAVMMATCISSALATAAMAFLANYPIALAPGMGHNFLFVALTGALGLTWQKALGLVFISGSLFVVLSLVPFRERILNDIPNCLKHGISVGIGILIALIGLEWSGLVVPAPGTIVGMGNLKSPAVLVTIAGLAATVALHLRGVNAALLWGILFSTVLSLVLGIASFHGIVGMPPSIAPTAFALDLSGLFDPMYLNAIFTFLFLDVFDTVGTLVGVGEQGGFIVNGKLPRAKGAFLADALGTVAGSLTGTSTVTSYIESAAGVGVGAKTGIASLVTAACFFLAVFFHPLVQTVGGGFERNGVHYYPTIASALIFVGYLMMQNLSRIDFHDFAEGFPAFIAIVMIPLTFSITDGIALSFIAFVVLKIIKGEFRGVTGLMAVMSFLFLMKFCFLG